MLTAVNGFFGKYRPFSNFWYQDTTLNGVEALGIKVHPMLVGVTFATNEHAFQLAKLAPTATLTQHELDDLLKMPPDRIKHWASPRGKIGSRFRKDWEEYVQGVPVKRHVMHVVNWNKYSANDQLLELLLSTDDARLIEMNTWGDKYWGAVQVLGRPPLGENHHGLGLEHIRLLKRKELLECSDS